MINLAQQIKDVAYGEIGELKLKKYFKDKWDYQIIKYEDKNAIHDFHVTINDKKYLIELKNRRINHYKYSTTMVGKNKIIEGRRRMVTDGIDGVIYVWCYNDGFYYWLDNDNCDERGKKQYYFSYGGNTSRGDNDKPLCYIYTKHLLPLHQLHLN